MATYLKQRGTRWYFQLAVPEELQDRFGKIIIESLHTSDHREALKGRDLKKAEWTLKFSIEKKKLEQPNEKSTPDSKAYEVLSDLRAILSDVLEKEHIAESEEIGIDTTVPEMTEAVLREGTDRVPLSVQKQVMQLSNAIMQRINHPLSLDPHDARSLLSEDVDSSNKSMSELRDEYIKFKEDEGLPEKTIETHKRHLKALESVVWDAQALKESLEGKAPKTIENYLTNTRTFSKWLQGKGIELPVPKFKRQSFSRTRDVFTMDELKTITESSMDETGKWVCMVSVHQGMRMGEILQLRFEDVREVHGHWCFDINDRGGKKVKNPSSIRVIPIHPWLISQGFLEYWKDNKGWARQWVSYDGSSSQGFSKFINPQIRKALGLETSSTPTGKKVFHSFRHTFSDHCREAGLHTEVIFRLGGWSTAGMGEGAAYGHGHSVKAQYESLASVEFMSAC